MKETDIQQFFDQLIKEKVECQLTPGIILRIESIEMQRDEENRLHVNVQVGDEEWSDSFSLIFPPSKK